MTTKAAGNGSETLVLTVREAAEVLRISSILVHNFVTRGRVEG